MMFQILYSEYNNGLKVQKICGLIPKSSQVFGANLIPYSLCLPRCNGNLVERKTVRVVQAACLLLLTSVLYSHLGDEIVQVFDSYQGK